MKIVFAPLQGYTELPYRVAHHRIFGGVETYYSPFLRIDHKEIRKRELKDITPEKNSSIHLIPQLIASKKEEFIILADAIRDLGYKEININMGCPFPPLAKRGYGSGILPRKEAVEEILRTAAEKYPDIRFSVKMRLGWESAEECMELLPILNAAALDHIILHPRVGAQQYKGEVDMEAFAAFAAKCEKPLFYNGDLTSVEDIERIERDFPALAGICIGRGLLAHPELAKVYQTKEPVEREQYARMIGELHESVYSYYKEALQGGEAQLLTKMKPFWEYLLPDGYKKGKKMIKKTPKLQNYETGVREVLTHI